MRVLVWLNMKKVLITQLKVISAIVLHGTQFDFLNGYQKLNDYLNDLLFCLQLCRIQNEVNSDCGVIKLKYSRLKYSLLDHLIFRKPVRSLGLPINENQLKETERILRAVYVLAGWDRYSSAFKDRWGTW